MFTIEIEELDILVKIHANNREQLTMNRFEPHTY